MNIIRNLFTWADKQHSRFWYNVCVKARVLYYFDRVRNMPRQRMKQQYPFFIPLRKWQRKTMFYLKMTCVKNKYAKIGSMKYQHNKVYNHKLVAATIDRIIIAPNETFSFWQLVRYADRRKSICILTILYVRTITIKWAIRRWIQLI